MATRAIASERDRGVGAAVGRDRDRERLADSRAGELSVAMRDRGVGAALEADKQTAGLESCLWPLGTGA